MAGQWAGRRLDAAPGTRPTTERAREALFSIWQSKVEGTRFLDLFCGSGAVGLEALSRGAASAVLVDRDAGVLRVTAGNQRRLAADRSATRRIDLPRGLLAARGLSEFGLVFADPPYAFEDWEALLEAIDACLSEDGEVALEHEAAVSLPPRVKRLTATSRRRYGGSALSFYVR